MNAINISSRTNALRLLRALAAAAAVVLLAVGATSCGVTEPDESAWQDVSNFSWPTTEGTLMRYRVEVPGKDATIGTEEVQTASEEFTYNGERMYMLYDESEHVSNFIRFLPQRDTLITERDKIGVKYALVSPLERGHTWIASYSTIKASNGSDSLVVPNIEGRIIDRFSQLKLNGHVYENAVVALYKPLDADRKDYWIRIFAQDVGAVRTIKYYPTQIDGDALSVLKSEDQFSERKTLIAPPTVN